MKVFFVRGVASMIKKIIVKIGSSSLTTLEGELDKKRIDFYAKEIVQLQDAGFSIIMVTSGAVAAGFKQMGYPFRPKLVQEKQAAAAVGQSLLMQAYHKAFQADNQSIAQILLTRSDFSNRKRIHNALNTIEELISQNIIPIINENDTVSIGELNFGDNDTLSALVANLVKAQQLIIITDTDGLYTEDPRKNEHAQKIDRVEQINEAIMKIAGETGSSVGTGGMRSKIEAARIAVRGGVPVFVGQVKSIGDLQMTIHGNGKGTYFDTSLQSLSMKKQWLGFHSLPKGKVIIDIGAEQAVLQQGKSLLPAGVTGVEGDFHTGDVIEVFNKLDQLIGRGVVNYTAKQIQAVAGLSTAEVKNRIDVHRIEIIHRDEWITLFDQR